MSYLFYFSWFARGIILQRKCLSIAGFDGSGGAGIQADLKTFTVLGCYGMTVLTALPIQNTQGVIGCYEIPLGAIEAQLQAIFDDITPDSIKIGMLFKQEIVTLVANFLAKHASGIPIVLDPVMVAKSGDYLLLPDAIETLKSKLFPLSTIITPNLPEAETLIGSHGDIELLAEQLLQTGANAVLLKGGHLDGPDSNDLYLDKKQRLWLHSPRLISNNTHGTGCTLSAACAAYLALDFPLLEACQRAKQFLFAALKAAQFNPIGKGHGPVDHMHGIYNRQEAGKLNY